MSINAPDLGGIYTDETVATDFTKLDLADQENLLLDAADELSDIKARAKAENAAKRKKAAETEAKLKELELLKSNSLTT